MHVLLFIKIQVNYLFEYIDRRIYKFLSVFVISHEAQSLLTLHPKFKLIILIFLDARVLLAHAYSTLSLDDISHYIEP